MATKHWVRDVLLTDPTNYIANGNHIRANALLYHFLRNAGFAWLWECDGTTTHGLDPNPVPDGNMEDTVNPPTYWTATGSATRQKVSSPVESGTRALEVDPSLGAGGVRSDDFVVGSAGSATGQSGASLSGPDAKGWMTYRHQTGLFNADMVGREFQMAGSLNPSNNGRFPIVAWDDDSRNITFYNPNGVAESYTTTTYEVGIYWRKIWMLTVVVANNSGNTLNVSVDRGDGSPIVVGTIPNNGGVFTRYNFSFSIQGSGSKYVYIESPASGSSFYIDSMHVWRSAWEYYMAKDEAVSGADPAHYGFTNNLVANHYGVDGILTNPDQFSTGSGDGYSPGADDVGKHLFVWDPNSGKNKNSGIYEIIADVGGGVVQVNLRSGSASFVNSTGLRWRIINIQQSQAAGEHGTYPNYDLNSAVWLVSAGFGIESPHSSKWRFFLRQDQVNGQNTKGSGMWSAPADTDFNQSTGHFYTTGPSVMRNRAGQYLEGGSTMPDMHVWRGAYTYKTSPTTTRYFIMTDEDLSFFHFFQWDPNNGYHATFLVGYHEPDVSHPGIMSFIHLAVWESLGVSSDIYWDGDPTRFAWQGTSYDHFGESVRCCAAQLGYADSNLNVHEMSNAQPNPWSGEEWLQELRIVNDPDGTNGVPSERDAGADFGVYQGRTNMSDLATFDSDNYLHIKQGLVWEWMGESLVP